MVISVQMEGVIDRHSGPVTILACFPWTLLSNRSFHVVNAVVQLHAKTIMDPHFDSEFTFVLANEIVQLNKKIKRIAVYCMGM